MTTEEQPESASFIFDDDERDDIAACAVERHISIKQLIHQAVMDDLARSASWGNELAS